MASDPLADPPPPAPPAAEARRPSAVQRVVALIEVVLCSDYPTQAALGTTLSAIGFTPYGSDGHLSATFVVTLSLVDTAILLGLIVFFLMAHGDRPRDVFIGERSPAQEASYGLPLVIVALAIGVAVLAVIQRFAPLLHNVERNPLQDLVRGRDVWLFALVVVIAGGVREELQRAFLLHRFERWLGGPVVGVVAVSLAFGAGHLLQGADAAITTGVLGAFWAIVYLRRRSVIAPVVSHSGFNLLQIVQFLVLGR